jgi:hypothetical protein
MSIQAALTFIQQTRDANKRQNSDQPTTLRDAVILAEKSGLTFTQHELQQAYRHDWIMRWARYTHSASRLI